MRGRIVRVHAEAGGHLVMSFDVGFEREDMAVAAVRILHPELDHFHMHADEQLSATAVAFLDLHTGEVRERHASLLVEPAARP